MGSEMYADPPAKLSSGASMRLQRVVQVCTYENTDARALAANVLFWSLFLVG